MVPVALPRERARVPALQPSDRAGGLTVEAIQGDILDQLRELPDEAVQRIVERDTDAPLQFEFERFHLAHPEVYEVLVKLARKAKRKGHDRLGIAMLWEVMRWEHMVGDQSGKEWKLNNNWKAFYARLIMEQEPDLAELFDTRRSVADV